MCFPVVSSAYCDQPSPKTLLLHPISLFIPFHPINDPIHSTTYHTSIHLSPSILLPITSPSIYPHPFYHLPHFYPSTPIQSTTFHTSIHPPPSILPPSTPPSIHPHPVYHLPHLHPSTPIHSLANSPTSPHYPP